MSGGAGQKQLESEDGAACLEVHSGYLEVLDASSGYVEVH